MVVGLNILLEGKWSHFDECFFQMGWFNHQLVTVCLSTNTWFEIRINVDDESMSSIVITRLHLSAKGWLRIVPFKRNIVLFCVFQVVVFLRCFLLSNKNMSLFIAGLFQEVFITSIITFTIGCVGAIRTLGKSFWIVPSNESPFFHFGWGVFKDVIR